MKKTALTLAFAAISALQPTAQAASRPVAPGPVLAPNTDEVDDTPPMEMARILVDEIRDVTQKMDILRLAGEMSLYARKHENVTAFWQQSALKPPMGACQLLAQGTQFSILQVVDQISDNQFVQGAERSILEATVEQTVGSLNRMMTAQGSMCPKLLGVPVHAIYKRADTEPVGQTGELKVIFPDRTLRYGP